MPEPVERGGTEQLVRECVTPFAEVEITGDDGGGTFVALGDEVMEVLIVRRPQGLEPEVVDDQQRHLDEILELTVIGVGGPGGMQRAEQL